MAEATTASDVAGSGLAALAFAVLGGLWTRFVLERQAFFRQRRVRAWDWGVVGVVGLGGVVALVVAGVMALTGTEFR